MSGERPASRPGLSESVREVATAFWERLRHSLPQKLSALVLATVFWLFVTTDDAFIAERTLRVPLRTEGMEAAESVFGLPEGVAVRLSGPSTRLRALEPDALDAVLDLRDVTGAFEETVRVFPPQGLTLLSVTPSEVLGTVEVRGRKQVPVAVVLLNASPEDTVLEARASPQQVQVRGPAGALTRVSRVLAPYNPAAPASQAELYAVDARGVPVPEVPYASVAIATFVFPSGTELPAGSGLLVPPSRGRAMKAATFLSQKWPHLAGRAEGPIVRTSAGRFGDVRDLQRPDVELLGVLAPTDALVRPETREHAGRGAAGFAHLSVFFLWLLGPLLVFGLSSPGSYARREAAKAFNFQLLSFLLLIATGIVSSIFPGDGFDPVFGLMALGWFVLTIVGGAKALQGESWRNPVTRALKLQVLSEK